MCAFAQVGEHRLIPRKVDSVRKQAAIGSIRQVADVIHSRNHVRLGRPLCSGKDQNASPV